MPALITAVIFVVLIGGAVAVIVAALRSRASDTMDEERLRFRWRFTLLPAAILVLTLILSAVYLPQLPAEVAYNFRGSATDSYFTRQLAFGLLFGLQLILLLPVAIISWGMTRMALDGEATAAEMRLKVERSLLLVTNLVALPQSLSLFALADIFSYNIYGEHLLPIWLFGAIVFALGTVFLVILFFKTIREKEPVPPAPPGPADSQDS